MNTSGWSNIAASEEVERLRQDLAAERKRREAVEDELHEERLAHTAAVTRAEQAERDTAEARRQAMCAVEEKSLETARAEQAEREREEARRDKRDMGAIISDTMDALEGDPDDNMIGLARARMGDLTRAEADNAALLGALQKSHACGKDACAQCDHVEAVLRERHPGAALLERMRALEALADAVREYLTPTFPSTVGDLFPVRKALAAFDALKVPRE